MSPLLQRKIRFSVAVYAIDVVAHVLRNWLARGQVNLVSERPDGTWRTFAFADIAVLSIMRKLVDFGIGVDRANEIATRTLAARPFLFAHNNTPPAALAALWRPHVLFVWRQGSDYCDAVDCLPEGITAHLTILVGPTITQAFDRVEEMLSDDP